MQSNNSLRRGAELGKPQRSPRQLRGDGELVAPLIEAGPSLLMQRGFGASRCVPPQGAVDVSACLHEKLQDRVRKADEILAAKDQGARGEKIQEHCGMR
eukprot:CAMPEP_0180443318 /NCGR_PEP_ID=MMETSP1036_2-20121128/14607_1 /TAXON_ID=632150 /ORGANISM="Azadinium spinosum, Strain 3D9" /LENGTH=98 /DNA_ID=CAMNT_0022449615 /DNA_START=552 /DNA_END=844 /DNA_ORIENTATION=+